MWHTFGPVEGRHDRGMAAAAPDLETSARLMIICPEQVRRPRLALRRAPPLAPVYGYPPSEEVPPSPAATVMPAVNCALNAGAHGPWPLRTYGEIASDS